MKLHLYFLGLFLHLASNSHGQIIISNNADRSDDLEKGLFYNSGQRKVIDIPKPSSEKINRLMEEDSLGLYAKGYRFAEPIAVDVDVLKLADWAVRGDSIYGKISIYSEGATSLSINFSSFFLPDLSEVFIYSPNGTVAGPITSNENNKSSTWATPVFGGNFLTIEIKMPLKYKEQLKLTASNVAYGYRKVDSAKAFGFGNSGSCLVNNNVVCPVGNGWQNLRNSVCMLLDANGSAFCSGSMINNLCNDNTPYVLTANHCFAGNPSQWRFVFQYWSPNCNPSQDDNNYLMYFGATFRSSNGASDFQLVQLNQQPPANSGIVFAGWDRTTGPATSGASIHHPKGDVMKISTFNTAVTREDNFVWPDGTFAGPGNQHWIVAWNNGVTERGSSGSPLFNQNQRIVGQLAGGPSGCGNAIQEDSYGRFDNSWTGGGTSATRLSNWLDPSGLGNNTAETIGVSYVSGPDVICTTGSFTISNMPPGTSVTSWSTNNTSLLTINPSGAASRVGSNDGEVVVTATLSNGCGTFTRTGTVWVGVPNLQTMTANGNTVYSPYSLCLYSPYNLYAHYAGNPTSATWSIVDNTSNASITSSYFDGAQISSGNTQGSFSVQIALSNACGSANPAYHFNADPCFYYSYTVSPNPAQNYLTIEFENSQEEKNFPESIELFLETTYGTVAPVRKLEIRDEASKQQLRASKKFTFDVRGLARGRYILRVTKEKEVETETSKKVETKHIVLN